jgi:ABC-type molybdate transport system permease subunit
MGNQAVRTQMIPIKVYGPISAKTIAKALQLGIYLIHAARPITIRK